MIIRALGLVLLIALNSLAHASEFTVRLDTLLAVDPGDVAIERYLDEQKASQVDNPEWYVAVANHFGHKRCVVLSTKPAEAGELSLTDASGKEAGSISDGQPDPESFQRAIDTLVDGVAHFPNRLDIRFGLAHLYQEIDDFDRMLATLDATTIFALAHAEEMRWIDGAEVPGSAALFIPETLQGYARDFYDPDDAASGKRFEAIAQLAVARYPTHPMAYNSLGAFWYTKGEKERAIRFFTTAHELDPSDPFVLVNLGRVQLETGHLVEARALLSPVAGSSADPEIKAIAKRLLDDANGEATDDK